MNADEEECEERNHNHRLHRMNAASINAVTGRSVHLICSYNNTLQLDIDQQISVTVSRSFEAPTRRPTRTHRFDEHAGPMTGSHPDTLVGKNISESFYLVAGSTRREASVGFDCAAEPPVTPVSPPPTAHLSPATCLHSDAESADLRVALVVKEGAVWECGGLLPSYHSIPPGADLQHQIRRIGSILCTASHPNFTIVEKVFPAVTQHNSSCDRRCPQHCLTVSADSRAFSGTLRGFDGQVNDEEDVQTLFQQSTEPSNNLSFDAEKVNHFAPLGSGSVVRFHRGLLLEQSSGVFAFSLQNMAFSFQAKFGRCNPAGFQSARPFLLSAAAALKASQKGLSRGGVVNEEDGQYEFLPL
ncbi:hypothetical protein Q8A73_011204 [Channa argus]|nr:hypothetical protein Q8A73_011204 [Channa argus]